MRTARRVLYSHSAVPRRLRRRWFHDETLKWGQDNPEIAQRCLNLPPFPDAKDSTQQDRSSSGLFRLQPDHSLADYLKWRQWSFPVNKEADISQAHALASHVLTAPLTIAAQLLDDVSTTATNPNKRHWCCIGARAEASLPLEYWKEILILWNARETDATPIHISLDFVGPETIRRPSVELEFQESTLELRWLYTGKFHDWINKKQDIPLSVFDAFILFNPGLGHSHLKGGWKPTLDLLLAKGGATNECTTLLTAHSLLDADRDADLLQEYGEAATLAYAENPFASRITYQDPFDAEHVVRPNHYVTKIRNR